MKKMKSPVIKTVVVILIGICIILPNAYTLAKYTSQKQSNHEQKSSEFYFSSNYLKEDSFGYEIYSNTLDIELYNYDLTNINNITSSEIVYNTSIKYYDASNVQIGNEITSINNTNWTSSGNGLKSPLTLENNVNADYAVVNVNSTTPYSKTLTARFDFNSPDFAPMYSLKNLTNGFTLIIMTGNETISNLEVSWPLECGPDNTNPNMSSWTTGANSNYLTNLTNNMTYALNFYCNLETVSITEIENEILNINSININLN